MPARGIIIATHDLIGVRQVVVIGWAAYFEIRPRKDDGRGIELQTPRRSLGDFWKFGSVENGVLTARSGLLGKPGLLTMNMKGRRMVILLPPDKMDLEVEVLDGLDE